MCTRSCETDAECRDGSVCVDDGGRKLCVNFDHLEAGICPEGTLCGRSLMSMAGEENSVGILAGEESGSEPEAGETSAEDEDAAGESGGMDGVGDGEGPVKEDSGCQSVAGTSNSLTLLLLFVLVIIRSTWIQRDEFI